MRGPRRRLRLVTADARRSPAAHLPGAREAAAFAACLNGLLVLLSLASTRAPVRRPGPTRTSLLRKGLQTGVVRNRRRYSVGVVSSLRRKDRTSVSRVPNPQAAATRSRVASVDSS